MLSVCEELLCGISAYQSGPIPKDTEYTREGRSPMFDEVKFEGSDTGEAENPTGLENKNLSEAIDGAVEDEELVETIEDWEPIYVGPQEFDIQEADDQVLLGSNGGVIKDIESLKSTIEALARMGTEEMRRFLARWVTIVFVTWTVIGLVNFIATGGSWLLVSDVGPGALFSLIVHHYFRGGDKDDSGHQK